MVYQGLSQQSTTQTSILSEVQSVDISSHCNIYTTPILLTTHHPDWCQTCDMPHHISITSFILKQPHKRDGKTAPRSYLLRLLLCMLCSLLLHLFDRLILSMAICFDLFAQLDQQTTFIQTLNPSGSSQRYLRPCSQRIQNQRAKHTASSLLLASSGFQCPFHSFCFFSKSCLCFSGSSFCSGLSIFIALTLASYSPFHQMPLYRGMHMC